MIQIHHIRNATMVIEIKDIVLLVDPMLSPKGSMPSYTEKRFNPQKNPIVDLPENCNQLLEKVTHCIITHLHSDHLDKAGEEFLIKHDIPVICSINDEAELKKRGLKVILSLEYWNSNNGTT
jgi:L-ascorbate metabolism protein UlaG (beta-lactamase superfamily)